MTPPDVLVRTLTLCVALASAETLHGILRAMIVTRRLGKTRALRLSIVSGTALAFAVCYLLVPGIGLRTAGAHVALGLTLAGFMAAFDAALGTWVLHRSRSQVCRDLDPRSGNLLLFGLMALVFIPVAVARLHGLI